MSKYMFVVFFRMKFLHFLRSVYSSRGVYLGEAFILQKQEGSNTENSAIAFINQKWHTAAYSTVYFLYIT